MDSELKKIIKIIDKLRLESDNYRPLKPEQEQRLIQKIRLDWNFHSNHIEGNSLTYSETKSFLLWHITAAGKPFRDYLEMKGHNEAVEYILNILKGSEITLTEHLIRELHKTILQEEYETDAITPDGKHTTRTIKPGQYKTLPNHIKTKSGSMFYFATPEETPSQMYDLLKWLNREILEKKNHPLIIASIFHYRFVRIHPFDDGNGRMSRLLMNFILMKYNYPPVIIPYEFRENYYNALQFADADDIDKFVIFIGERLIDSLKLVLKAGNNEPLDEDDDIDKMVKMLEKKIAVIDDENTLQKELSFESFQDTFEKSIKPLLFKLFEKIELFTVFFNDFYLELNFESEPIILKTLKPLYFTEFLDFCYDFIEKQKIIHEFKICFKFTDFKKSSKNHFDINIRIAINFKQFLYIINSPNLGDFEVSKMYHQNLKDEEIDYIIVELAKHLNTLLENEINNINNKK